MRKMFILSLASLLIVHSFGKELSTSVPEVKKEVVNEEKIILDDYLSEEEIYSPTTSDTIEVNDISSHIYLRFGGDIYSKYSKFNFSNSRESLRINDGKTKGLGYSFGIEVTKNMSDSFEVGMGVAYHINAKNKEKTIGTSYKTSLEKYDSIPIYLIFKYNFNLENTFTPYIKANLGYAFNVNEKDIYLRKESYKTKINDGAYGGIGIGAAYENFFTDLMYQVTFAKTEPKNAKKGDLDYSRVTLSLGYKLDI